MTVQSRQSKIAAERAERKVVRSESVRSGDHLVANCGVLPGPLQGIVVHAHREGWGYRIETLSDGSYWFDYADEIEVLRDV